MPSSTTFSTSHFCRSPLGSATPKVTAIGDFPVDLLAAANCQFYAVAADLLDQGVELPARTVKKRDARPRPGTHHVQQMMGLRANQDDAVGHDRRLNEVAIGHG